MYKELAKALNLLFGCDSKQNSFRATHFQPTFFKYAGIAIPGVQWFHERIDLQTHKNGIEGLPLVSIFKAATIILICFKELSRPAADVDGFLWDGGWFGYPGPQLVDMYAGTTLFREMIDAGKSVQEIIDTFKVETDTFFETRKPFLLYA